MIDTRHPVGSTRPSVPFRRSDRLGIQMSIRLIAKDLYRVMHAIETLEGKIARTPAKDRPSLEAELRKLRAEYADLRRALDGAKG